MLALEKKKDPRLVESRKERKQTVNFLREGSKITKQKSMKSTQKVGGKMN